MMTLQALLLSPNDQLLMLNLNWKQAKLEERIDALFSLTLTLCASNKLLFSSDKLPAYKIFHFSISTAVDSRSVLAFSAIFD